MSTDPHGLVANRLTVCTSVGGVEKEHSIDANCVIGLQSVSWDGEHERRLELLYVNVAEGEEQRTEEKTTFQSLAILAPSEEAIRDFYPTNLFCPKPPRRKNDRETLLYVVVSTGSGIQLAPICYERLVKPCLGAMGFEATSDYTVYYTKSAETITELTKSVFLPTAERGISQSIILLSGDGGVIDIVNGLFSSRASLSTTFIQPCIALIPTGTGNAMAISSGVMLDHTLGLSTLFRGYPRAVPLFKVQLSPDSTLLDPYGQPVDPYSAVLPRLAEDCTSCTTTVYGAVVFSYGLHACLVADSDTPDYRKHGSARFKMAAKDLLFPSDGTLPHQFTGRVSVSKMAKEARSKEPHKYWEEVPRTSHAYVLATLMSQLEKGFTISPASKALDGKLRLIHFGPMSEGGKDIMDVMQAAYNGGKHVEDERVRYEEIDGLKIEFGEEVVEEEEQWRRICVDGKIFRVGSKGWVTVEMEDSRPVDLMWLKR